MHYKEVFSVLAIALTLYAFYPYIRSILRGETRPHVFSWVIWASTTLIVFFAALAGGGGVGAWPIGVSSLLTIYIALLAYRHRGDASITRTDKAFFAAAMASLPLWYFTADPLWAVVVLTMVDLLGFGPTLRKAYDHPFEEKPLFFGLFALRNLIVVAALEHYSLTTVLFPALIALACMLLIGIILIRRRQLTT